jgi:hypothetical protein
MVHDDVVWLGASLADCLDTQICIQFVYLVMTCSITSLLL